MSTRYRALPQAGTRRAFLAGAGRALAVLAVIMTGTLPAPHAQASRLLVNGALGNSILRFDGQTGAFTDLFAPAGSGGLSFPDGLAIGPDGNIYVRSAGSVLRFNGTTGAFINVFASGGAQSPDYLSFELRWDQTTQSFVATSAAGGLDGPTGLVFGPDGNVYVSSYGSILRYNGATGAPMGTFASGGGLVNATGVTFGPDHNLYVSNYPGNTILEYNGSTGALIGTFVSAGSGGLNRPIGLAFGPKDGNLYVCSYNTNSVLQYNGSTGAAMGAFTSTGLSGPTDLTFGMDGNLYVSSYISNSVASYNGTTGAFINYFVASASNGLNGPFGLSFSIEAPSGLTATVQSGSQVNLSWTNNSPDATGVEIWRKTGTGTYAPMGVVNPNTTTYADQTVSENTAYTYRLQAVDSSLDSASSNEASATTPLGVPTAPANLSATSVSGADAGTQIALSWQNTSTTQTSLAIERKTGSGSYVPVTTLDGSHSGFLDTGLTPNTAYTYHIQAINSAGSSLWSNEASAATQGAPTAPTNLSASAISGTQVTLTWTNTSNSQTGLVIERKPSGGVYTPVGPPGATDTSFTDTGLTPNTTYTYHIEATNSVGPSGWSSEASATTLAPPTAPTALSASVLSSTQISLSWTNTSTVQTGIEVDRKTGTGTYTPVTTLAASATSFTDGSLSPNTAYTYHIKATNSAGSSDWTGEVSATTFGPPAAPTGLSASVVSGTQVALSWTASSGTVYAYAIWRQDATNTWTRVGLVGSSTTSYTDTTVSANATYSYHVRATNNIGPSDWSNTVTVTTSAPPTAPSNLAATSVSGTQVALSWTASSGTVYAYAIWRQDATNTWTRVGLVGSTVTSYTDTTVSANATYSYHVRATNNVGPSDWSNTVTVTTSAPPTAPTNLSASAISGTQVTLTWTNTSNSQTGLVIERKTGSGSYVPVGPPGATDTSFTDTGLTPNTTYTYHIEATNSVGPSGWSSEASATTLAPPTAPTALSASVLSSTQISLSWTASSGTVYAYAIWRQDATNTWTRVGLVGSTVTSYTDTTVSANATYSYHVRATNNVGPSDWSNTVTVTATAGPPTAPTNLVASAASGPQVSLSWTASSGTVYAYAIWRQDATNTWTRVGLVGSTVTSYTDATVSANATYSYHVRATNNFGASDWSNMVTVTTAGPPTAPTNLAATSVSGTQVTLTWTNTSNSQTGLVIERKTGSGSYVPVGPPGATDTSFTDTGLTPNTTYTYHIEATNSVGPSGWSSEASATTLAPPTAPTALSASVLSSTQISLSWTASSGTVYAYAIWREDATNTWTRVGLVGSTVTSYTDTTVSANATYSYHVRATNNVGPSDWSNTVTVTATAGPPAAPTNLVASAASGPQVSLSWTASSGNVYAYAIWRQDATNTWTRVGLVGPTVTSYTDTTVSVNATYSYHVRATNNFGASDWSNLATVTTGGS